MAIDSQYPAQLIAMVSDEAKASYRAEADSRRVSIGQVVRERLELAEAAREGRVVGLAVYPDVESAQDAVEQMASNFADERDRSRIRDEQLAAIPAEGKAALLEELTERSAFAPSEATHEVVSDTGQGGMTVRDRDEDDDDEPDIGPSLAELAKALPPDDGIEDMDEHLQHSNYGESAMARLQARGLL